MNFQDLNIQIQPATPNNARTQLFSTLVRPGVKFNDADPVGSPVRITVGERALKEGMVELKPRNAQDKQFVPLESLKNLTFQEQFWELIYMSINESLHPRINFTGTGASERPAR